LVLSLAAVGVALLGPRAGFRTERISVSGVDLVVLIDVSRSMDARDVPPSRLERAVRVAEEVLSGLGPGDRAALAAFAGRGVLLTPLTPDTRALQEMLAGFDAELMQKRSSELGAGIRAALTAFPEGSARPRVVLLLSDGEAPSGQDAGDTGMREALRAGVRVVAVGLGSQAGTTVPDHGLPLLDASGRVVISRRDLSRLSALAEATSGELEATDALGALDSAHLLATLRRDAPSAPGASVERRLPRLWAWPLAALAFGLLLGEGTALSGLRSVRGSGVALLSGWLLLWLVSGAEPAAPDPLDTVARRDEAAELPQEPLSIDELEVLVRARPEDPLVLLRLGLAHSREGRNEDAERAYLAAGLRARDPAIAALAWYDLGVAELAQGDLAGARNAFFDALALDPRDSRAQFNLEWTLRALAEHPASPSNPSRSDPRKGPEKRSDNGKGPGARDKEAAPGQAQESSPPAGPPREDERAESSESAPSSKTTARAPTQEAFAQENARVDRPAPVLTPEDARRLLASVSEEPGHALHQAARRPTRTGEPGTAPLPGGPAW
jgi:Ca-activated chloride channel family protein